MKQWFNIKELVCPHIYDRHGEKAWRLFDPRIIEVMTWLRRTINKRIYVNRPSLGLNQRGIRCNLCSLVKDKTVAGILYVSPHLLAAAFDFDVEGMTAQEVRDWIDKNKEGLPHPIRLEMDVSWVHLDVLCCECKKITYIKP